MMASENVDLLKMDGPSKPVGLNLRSNSTGKAVSQYRKEKVVPHYLRASTGSCHDLCKFGGKHVRDVNERTPIAKVRMPLDLKSHSSVVSGATERRSSLASEKLEISSKISLLKPEVKLPAKHVTSSTQSSIMAATTKSTGGLMVKKDTPKPKSTLKSVSASRLSQTMSLSKVAPKMSERYPIASLSPRSPLMRFASFHARSHGTLKKCASEEQNNDEVEEKTFYVVKMESGSKSNVSPSFMSFSASSQSFSSQEDQEESNFLINGVDGAACLASNVTGNVEKQESTIEKRTVTPIKDVSNRSYTHSPRRLRFMKGRVMDETTSFKCEARRRRLKKTSRVSGDAVEAASGPEKVVLKHQDVEDKKDVPCLLNHVIEETASKLVQLKKSKVKALVSAFETVISLQERKPDVSIVN